MRDYQKYFQKEYEIYFDMFGEIGFYISPLEDFANIPNKKMFGIYCETKKVYEEFKDATASKDNIVRFVNKYSVILEKLEKDKLLQCSLCYNHIYYTILDSIRALTKAEVRIPLINAVGISYNGLVKYVQERIEIFNKEISLADNFHKTYIAYIRFFSSSMTALRLMGDDCINQYYFPDTPDINILSQRIFTSIIKGYEDFKSGRLRTTISYIVANNIKAAKPYLIYEPDKELVYSTFRNNSMRIQSGERGRGVF